MSDGFAEMITFARGFFADLAANNDRAWFEPRKADYETRIRKPALLMADIVAEDLARRTGQGHVPKVFRIHRDVRFSKDKSPYNPHLHISWSRPTAARAPVWFFGAAPDYLIVGTGLMGLSGEALTAYRAMIDRDGAALSEAIDTAGRAVGATISEFGPAPLKRVPKPYASDHPQGDLLKRKALTVTAPFPPDWAEGGLIPRIDRMTDALIPVWRILDAGIA